jgi:hypothetical protein
MTRIHVKISMSNKAWFIGCIGSLLLLTVDSAAVAQPYVSYAHCKQAEDAAWRQWRAAPGPTADMNLDQMARADKRKTELMNHALAIGQMCQQLRAAELRKDEDKRRIEPSPTKDSSRQDGGRAEPSRINAMPTSQLALVNDARWKPHTEWALNQLMICQQRSDDSTACNRFVGAALERVYGLDDFRRQDGEYLTANQIYTQILVDRSNWVALGRASDQDALTMAQSLANRGYAVVAIRPDNPNGHVAMIVPGQLSASSAWAGLLVPNSASLRLNDPARSYVGGMLSRAFGADKRHDVILYQRLDSDIQN